MKRLTLLALVLMVALAACDSGDDNQQLPTRVVLGEVTEEGAPADVTVEVTENAIAQAVETEESTPEIAPTNTYEPTNTAIPSETSTPRPTATFPPPDTATPSRTPDANASATAAVIEAPRISTLTPIPVEPGVNPPTPVPFVAADVVITAQQLQAELDQRIVNNPAIEAATLTMIEGNPQGVQVRLTASGGQALVTGNVFIAFQLSGDFVTIGVLEIDIGGGDPPQRFQEIATGDVLETVIESFDAILTRRLGEQHDLERLTVRGNQMDIMLLIPE